MASPISGRGSSINSRSSSTNIFLIIISVMTLCLIVSTGTRVNCRKFVFAPICRGVAAKRAQLLPDENDVYQSQERKPEMIDVEYPFFALQDGDNIGTGLRLLNNKKRNNKNLLREMIRRRKIYQQQQTQRKEQETHSQQPPLQQQQLELLDTNIYDYK